MPTIKERILDQKLLVFLTVIYICLILYITLFWRKYSLYEKKSDTSTSAAAAIEKEREKDGYKPKKNNEPSIKLILAFLWAGGSALLAAWISIFFPIISYNTHFLKNILKYFFISISLLGFIGISIFFFLRTPWSLTLFINLLNLFIVTGVFLTIMELIYKNVTEISAGPRPRFKHPVTPDFGRFILNILYLVPYLFLSFTDYIKDQFKITTPRIWLILLVEMLLIGLRLLIPILYSLYKKWMIPQGNTILENSAPLNKLTSLGIFQNHEKTDKLIFNYNYAISCDIWINPQPPNTNLAYTKSTSILDYGEVLKINY